MLRQNEVRTIMKEEMKKYGQEGYQKIDSMQKVGELYHSVVKEAAKTQAKDPTHREVAKKYREKLIAKPNPQVNGPKK